MTSSQLGIKFLRWQACPSCGTKGITVDRLEGRTYRFGRARIPYPGSEGIPILRCPTCTLVFKGYVPDPEDLKSLFGQEASNVWRPHKYLYAEERERILAAAGRPSRLDLFDVGAGSGDILRLFQGLAGRRSALDVATNPACQALVNGEYIRSFIEDDFRWSKEPYDVVTAYDVMEHLYRPGAALRRLLELVKPGGRVVVQTGDADTATRQ